MSEKVLNSVYARRMKSIGLMPVPCKSNKSSTAKWKELSFAKMDDAYFNLFDQVPCLALVTGEKSGNLELLDVDSKYDLTGQLYSNLQDNIIEYSPELWNKLVISTTPSGGFHIIYKCPKPGRNKKYACRFVTQKERDEEGIKEGERRVLLESRGEGGYFLTFPSEGYDFIQGSLAEISMLTDSEHAELINICKSFDEVGSKERFDINSASDDVLKSDKFQKSTVIPSNLKRDTKWVLTPWDDINQRPNIGLDILARNGWTVTNAVPSPTDGRIITYIKRPGNTEQAHSATWNHVPNRLWCWSSSTPFKQEHPISAFDIFKHYEAGGNIAVAINLLHQQGYGVKAGGNEVAVQQPPPAIPAIEQLEPTPNGLHRGATLEIWWKVDVVVRKNGDIVKTITIKQMELYDWLSDKGFRHIQNGEDYSYVHIDNNIVYNMTKVQVINWIIKWCNKLPNKFDFIERSDLIQKAFNELEKLLHTFRISQVKKFTDDMLLRDTKSSSYIPFKNGVLKITKTDTELVPYEKIHKLIWHDHIKDIDYLETSEEDMNSHPFSNFLYDIASSDADRYRGLLSLMGYCMSTYKDPANPAAVILCDTKVSDRSEGGTGKGILIKSMGYIRNVVIEDGKSMNNKMKTEFRFGRITDSTQIYNLSDVEKGFDFESLFSVITEGIPVRKLYTAETYIPYEKSPKIIISTNYSIGGRGSSHDRRRIEFELADYYSSRYTPEDKYKHHFFDDWTATQWAEFYCIMARCLRLYLKNGSPKFKGINIELRKFIDESSSDFSNWFFAVYGDKDHIDKEGIKNNAGNKRVFSSLYQEYLLYAGLDRNDIKPRKFLQMMESGCRYLGLELRQTSEKAGINSSSLERHLHIVNPKMKINQFDKPSGSPTVDGNVMNNQLPLRYDPND